MANKHASLPPRMSTAVLIVGIVLGLALCIFIAQPFLPALVWSLTLAVLFAPVERRLAKAIRLPGFSAPLTLLLAAVIVVVPVVLVSGALAQEIINGANSIGQLLAAQDWAEFARRRPGLSPVIDWANRNLALEPLLQSLPAMLGGWSASLLRWSLTSLVNLLLTFFFLFYLLRDREQLLGAAGRLLPLSAAEFALLTRRSVKTIFASVYGTAAVAALQGALGGLVFWWLGLPSPLFWGVIMGLLAIVPFLGAFVVWVPAAITLALSGQLLSAVILVAWGTLVVGLVDNIVYPILVGRQLAMHSMLSFIAIIGGLVLFGAHGIVLGPLIVAGSQVLLEICRTRLDREASPEASPKAS